MKKLFKAGLIFLALNIATAQTPKFKIKSLMDLGNHKVIVEEVRDKNNKLLDLNKLKIDDKVCSLITSIIEKYDFGDEKIPLFIGMFEKEMEGKGNYFLILDHSFITIDDDLKSFDTRIVLHELAHYYFYRVLNDKQREEVMKKLKAALPRGLWDDLMNHETKEGREYMRNVKEFGEGVFLREVYAETFANGLHKKYGLENYFPKKRN